MNNLLQSPESFLCQSYVYRGIEMMLKQSRE